MRDAGRRPQCPAWPQAPLSGPITGPGRLSFCLGEIRLSSGSRAVWDLGSASVLLLVGSRAMGGLGGARAQQVKSPPRASISPFLKRERRLGNGIPPGPPGGLGPMTSSQTPTSAAPSYPTAGVVWVIQPENWEGPSPASSTSSSLSHRTPSSQLSSSPPPFYRTETRSPRAAWDQAKSQAPQHRLSDPASPLGGQGLHLSGNLSHGHPVSSYPLLCSVPKSSPGPCLSARTVPKATVRVLSGPRRVKGLDSARNTSPHKPRPGQNC